MSVRKSLHGWVAVCDKHRAVEFLDCTHLPISGPNDHPAAYWSTYKSQYTQNSLICVNPFALPGSGQRPRTFNQCTLASNYTEYVSDGEVIVADGGFMGGPQLLVQFHSDAITHAASEDEKADMISFNDELNEGRVLVEWQLTDGHLYTYTCTGGSSRYPANRTTVSQTSGCQHQPPAALPSSTSHILRPHGVRTNISPRPPTLPISSPSRALAQATPAYFSFFRLCLSFAVERPLSMLLAVSECDITTSVSNIRPGNTICKSVLCAQLGSKPFTSFLT